MGDQDSHRGVPLFLDALAKVRAICLPGGKDRTGHRLLVSASQGAVGRCYEVRKGIIGQLPSSPCGARFDNEP